MRQLLEIRRCGTHPIPSRTQVKIPFNRDTQLTIFSPVEPHIWEKMEVAFNDPQNKYPSLNYLDAKTLIPNQLLLAPGITLGLFPSWDISGGKENILSIDAHAEGLIIFYDQTSFPELSAQRRREIVQQNADFLNRTVACHQVSGKNGEFVNPVNWEKEYAQVFQNAERILCPREGGELKGSPIMDPYPVEFIGVPTKVTEEGTIVEKGEVPKNSDPIHHIVYVGHMRRYRDPMNQYLNRLVFCTPAIQYHMLSDRYAQPPEGTASIIDESVQLADDLRMKKGQV